VNRGPALDASSFEKLLAAVWVLQGQQERKPHAALPFSVSPIARPPSEETLITNEKVSLPPDAKTKSIGARRNRAPVLSADLRKWIESWKGYRFKIRIKDSSRRAAMAACLPSLILAVILAFVLSEISQQGHEVAAATSVPVNVPAEVGNPKVASADARSADLQSVGASKSSETLSDSHKRITDPDTLRVVEQLSPYEIRVLRWEAEGGDDSAALTMGMLYETGRYVPQSCGQAAKWVMKSANWGNAAAEYNLGLRYRQGDGVPSDAQKAEQWLQKAADQNYSQAAAVLKEASRGY
jgi:hypothetical protein